MNWITEPFATPFMQRALAAGIMVSLLGGYYGALVVQRGLSFLGNGLAHAAFGGVALGLLLGVEPLWVALPFTLAVAQAMAWAQGRGGVGGDAAIGVFYAAAMALGVLFISRAPSARDPNAYLFGSILFVSKGDLWIIGVALALSLATLPVWRRWAYATFDRELALADRQPVRRDDAILYAAIAGVVVVAVKLVGLLLVGAFLVIPAAAARLWSRTFAGMTALSMALGAASSAVGLWVSYDRDLPSGACIVLVQAGFFLTAMAARRPNR